MTRYKIYWDNGASAAGVFPDTYDTEEAAEIAGRNWYVEFCYDNGLDPDDESHEACFEVIEEPKP
jgi:hypothetical protein